MDKVRMIHEALPHCRLTNGTNGDCLDASIIQHSADAGLAFLHINYYPANEELENQNQWLDTFLQRFLMYYYDGKAHMDMQAGYYKAQWRIGGMEVEFESKRPCDVMCSNRGGAVGESYTCTTSCMSTRLYIDYIGDKTEHNRPPSCRLCDDKHRMASYLSVNPKYATKEAFEYINSPCPKCQPRQGYGENTL